MLATSRLPQEPTARYAQKVLIQEINQILEDTKDRSSFSIHLDVAKLVLLHETLKRTHACIIMTQDFTDILDVLEVDEREPQKFEMFFYLYYQAHYLDLYESFKPIIDNLNTRSHILAGDAFGATIEDLVSTIKEEGSAHLALAAFGNGASITLDIESASHCNHRRNTRPITRKVKKAAIHGR